MHPVSDSFDERLTLQWHPAAGFASYSWLLLPFQTTVKSYGVVLHVLIVIYGAFLSKM